MADREDGGRRAPSGPDDFGTQPLPMVGSDGAASDGQPVRAVAKRVPSALPAIGRDESSDLPASARATADRRRREREGTGGDAADPEPQPAQEPQAARPPVPRQRESAEDPPRVEQRTPVVVAATVPAPDVELVPIGSRSRAVATPVAPPVASVQPPAGESPAPPPSKPAPGPADAPKPARHAAPGHETPRGGGLASAPPPPPPPPPPPAPPVMGQPPDEPEPARGPDIVEGEIIDERPRPGAADAQTDEWATVPAPGSAAAPPAPAGPRPGPLAGPPGPRLGPPPVPRPGPPLRPEPPSPRPGPAPAVPGVLASDSWAETEPLPPVADAYQGRRRRVLRRVGSRPSRAGWLVVLGVVLSLSAAVAVPFLITDNAARDVDAAPTGGRPSSTVPTATASSGSSGLPVIMAPTATPTPPPTTSVASATTAGQTATSPALQAPGVPGTPTVSGPTVNSLTLAWSGSSGTVSEYRVESCRGGGCSNFAQFGTTSLTTISVGSLNPGTVYRFRVRAANSAGTSGYSGIANGTTTAFSLTLQGEAGTPSGCAAVRNVPGASNGQVMDRIGDNNDWNGCGTSDGAVTFNNVDIPVGTYTVTIYYVFNEQNGDSQRYARLRLTAGGTTIDFGHTYLRTTTVKSWTTSSFTRNAAATFTITYSNPGVQGQDRSPALDRIVIQQST